MLGIKQREKNINFWDTYNNIEKIITKKQIDEKIKITVSKIIKRLNGQKFGLAWSGGKDSVVIDFVLRKAFNYYPCVIGMTRELEYPEFMKFVTNNMPEGLEVYMTNHTLKWLSENEKFLFPQNSKIASQWFKMVQHNAQNDFYKKHNLDVLCTGRRKLDSNYTGINGEYKNNKTEVIRYSPIYDWNHEEILATIKYYNLPLAPFYYWKNGFIVGSGNWAARQWTGSINDAWNEIFEIDKSIVIKASKYIKSAELYVRNLGI